MVFLEIPNASFGRVFANPVTHIKHTLLQLFVTSIKVLEVFTRFYKLLNGQRRQKCLKLTLPAGCHHNPNLSLNITFYIIIIKVLSCYLKPYMDCK